ncbi:DUF4097 family beta strand repeat-containing protein [Kitasatospora sp. NPDC057542]|uniref:DUF4097 family beta strand repeat-containing protein n=1 Tax=Kitasatospora sp. NPDC057542 TaxID=3346162 RepID=UPI003688FB26
MSTARTFRATHADKLALDLPTGDVRVFTHPDATAITVLLTTDDDHGPAADAVNQARMSENRNTLNIDVPHVDSGITVTTRSGRTLVTQSVVTGNVTGMTIVNGRIVAGGGIHHAGVSPVTATVLLPPAALGMALKTLSADLTATGHLRLLAITSTSGDVHVDSVDVLTVTTVSGDVFAQRIGADAEIWSTSGDVRIAVHEGHATTVNTVGGDVRITAGTRATGRLSVRTVSGNIDLSGTGCLDVTACTVSGRKNQR